MKILIMLFFLSLPLHADNHILVQENFDGWQFACIQEQSQKVCDLREVVFDPNTKASTNPLGFF